MVSADEVLHASDCYWSHTMNLFNTKTVEITLGLLAAALLIAAGNGPQPSASAQTAGNRATCHWQRPLQKNGAMPVLVPGCPRQGVL
jgi:hypothetical protein